MDVDIGEIHALQFITVSGHSCDCTMHAYIYISNKTAKL